MDVILERESWMPNAEDIMPSTMMLPLLLVPLLLVLLPPTPPCLKLSRFAAETAAAVAS